MNHIVKHSSRYNDFTAGIMTVIHQMTLHVILTAMYCTVLSDSCQLAAADKSNRKVQKSERKQIFPVIFVSQSNESQNDRQF